MDVLVDTNILLRRLHRAHPQHRQARDAITKFSAGGDRVCVTSRNLIELSFGLFARAPWNTTVLASFLAKPIAWWSALKILSFVCLIPTPSTPNGAGSSLRTVFPARKAHDARLVAVMLSHGVANILTFNTGDFVRYPGITVLDPSRY